MKTVLRPATKKLKGLIQALFSCVLFTLCFASAFNGYSQTSQVFNANGTYTVPAGVYSITVEAWGGGGKGGTRSTNGVGGGGGGGAYSRSIMYVTPGQVFTVNVGGGATSTAAGGDSWFGNTTILLAKGGNSVSNNNATGAVGGNAGAGLGDVRYSGGDGRSGNTSGTDYGGGGGSSAGPGGNGTDATNNNGAIAPAGGGNGGLGRFSTQAAGSAGAVPGGGGGGALRTGGFSTYNGGNGATGRVTVTVPAYAAQFLSMDFGSAAWCAGETRTVSVTVKNVGTATWTDAGPDINIGVKWNGDPDYLVRADGSNLAPGATQTYSFSMTAPAAPATNNLSFDAVYEGVCWFGNNAGSCGPGNVVYTSPLITIATPPSIGVHPSVVNRTYCEGAAAAALSVSAAGTGITYQWFSNSVNSNSGGTLIPGATSANYTPPTNVSGTTYYYATVTGCSATLTSNVSGSYTVNANASLALTTGNSTQSMCIGASISDIIYNTGGSATGAIISSGSLPPGVTGTFSAGTFTISGTPSAPGTYNFTVQTTGSLCTNPSLSGSITIQGLPVLSQTSLPGLENQSVCINTPISSIIYLVAGGATGATVTGLPAGISSSLSAGVLTISGSPTVEGVFNFSVNTTGPLCANLTLTGSITVGGDGTLALTSAPSTINQNVCEGSPIVPITYSVGGTSTGATIVSGSLPAGVTGDFSGGVFTISGVPTTSGVYNFTIGATGSACVNPQLSATLTVSTPASVNLSSAAGTDAQVVCISNAITSITYAIGGGATGASITAGSLPAGVTGVYNSGTFTISGTPSAFGNFNFTITTSGSCSNAAISGSLSVNQNSAIVLSSGNANPVICINTALTPIVYTVSAGATGAVLSAGSFPAGVSGNFSGSSFSISGTPVVSGSFPFTITTTGPCINNSLSGTILVNANGTISLNTGNNNQTVCINNAISAITYTIGGGATSASIVAGSLPAGVTGTFSAGIFTISGTPTVAGTYNFTVRANGPCVQPSLTGSITVQQNSTILPASASQTRCINTAMTSMVFTTSGGATGASITAGALPSGVTGSFAGSAFTISGTPTVAGTYTFTVTTTGPCINTSATGTIIVTENATIALTSGAGSNIQGVCVSQQAISPITYVIGGSGTGATISGLPAGVTGSYNAGTKVYTISGTPTASGTFNFTVTTTGPCVKPVATGTITVYARPVANAITGDDEVCVGSTLALASNATGTAPLTYTWLSSNPAIASVSNTGVVTGVAAGTANISYTVTNATGCTQTSAGFAVTVKPIATGALTATENSGSTPNDMIICSGDNVTFTAPAGYAAYNFKVNGVSVQNGVSRIFNSTSLTNGASVTVDVSNSSSCTVTFAPIVITVHAVPTGTLTATESSVTPNDNNICSGTAVTFTATPGFSTYVFLVNGSGVQSSPSNTFTTSALTGTSTVTVQVTNANGCKTTFGAQVITVHDLPSGTLVATENSGLAPNDNMICSGDNITFTATAGFATYTFIVNGSPEYSGPVNTYSTTALGNPSVVTVEVSNAGGCTATFGPVIISVNDVPSGSLTILENSGIANDAILCAGETALFSATTGYDNYTFMVNGITVQDGASSNYSTSSLLNGDVVSVEVSGGGGCTAIFDPVAVTILELPAGTLTVTETSVNPNDNIICEGSQITFTAPSGYANYNFTINGLAVQNGSSNIFISSTISNGDVVNVLITGINGCPVNLTPVTITVNPVPAGTMVISETSGTTADDAIVCSGDMVTFTATAGFAGYNFFIDGVSVQNGVSNVYSASNLLNGVSVTVEIVNASGCRTALNAIVLTVNDLPVASLTASETVICPNSAVTFTATPGFDAYTFMVNGSPVQTGASNVYVSNTLTSTSSVSVAVTNANGCTATAAPVDITVNPVPAGTLNATETSGNSNNDGQVCAGENVTFTATAGYAVYDFKINGISVQNSASNTYSSGSLSDGDIISVEVQHANGCSATFNTINITVHQFTALAPVTGVMELCVNSTTTLSNSTGGGTWSSLNPAIATVNSSTGVVTAISGGTATIQYSYTNSNGCTSTITADVTVNALPNPTLTGPNPFCPETTSYYFTEPGQSNYTWTVTGGIILSGGSSTDNSITIDWSLPGTKSIFVNYTNANGCSGATSATVTSSTGTVPVIAGHTVLCQNGGAMYTTQAGQNNYIWTVTGGFITAGGTTTDEYATITWTTPGTGIVEVNFTNASGCTAANPTVYPVTVNPLPTATVSGTTSVCNNAAQPVITFTGAGGTAPYTFTYSINGGANETITTVSGNSVTIPVPTNVVGDMLYTLIHVLDSKGCNQPQGGIATVTVNPLPEAVISGSTTVCEGSSSPLVTFTGSVGTSPFSFTYTINGGSVQTVTAVSGNTATVAVPTIPGTFVYDLVGVADTYGCSQNQSGSVTITVNPLPLATISGSTSVCINSASPVITFTGSGGVSPYTFTYNINGGAPVSVISTGNTATVNAPTNTAGSFNYNLVSVTDASSTVCSQTQAGIATVVIYAQSVGGVTSGSAAVCTGTNSGTITLSGNTGSVIRWESSVNGGTTWTSIANTTNTLTYNNLTQTTLYHAVSQSGNCTEAVSANATITVNGLSAGGTVNSGTTVCSTVNSGTLTLSGQSGSVVRWERSVDGGSTWITIANTTTSLAYSNLTQTTIYRAVVSNGSCAAVNSIPATITVTPRPTGVLSGSGAMCTGGTKALTITVTGTGTISGTLTGGIPFSGMAPVITVNVSPAVNTTYSIVSLSDANCAALPANLSGSATVTIDPLPATFIITPSATNFCQGSIQSLIASGSVPSNATTSVASGSINQGIPDAGLFGSGTRTHNLNVSGIPANAVITSVVVNFNITHTAAGELVLNIKAPNGNVLNMVNKRGGTGNNFTNTNISSAGVTPVNSVGVPFTGTYAPDAQNNVGPGGGNSSNVASFNGLYGTPNGNWTFIAEDDVWLSGFFQTNTGTLNSWNITINYTLPSSLPVTWSPFTGLFTDPGATIPYAGQSMTTVYANPAAGTHTYTATSTNVQGCGINATTTLTVNPAPVVTITADYCSLPGQIQLTATSVPAATSYIWSTGATTQSIAVDEAAVYEVTVNSSLGCPGRASISVAQELVVNGDFEDGNTGFFTEYTPATGFDLYPEGHYAVGTDAHLYHDNFYGKDHTTTAQTGNFLMINGSSTLIGSPGRLRTIWQQTVNVLPNTSYYFSAWAMNLNPGSPAQLQFEVNGVPIGTVADLNVAPKPTSNGQVNIGNWVRFYSNPTWNSGGNTTATIRIINLNTAPGGNDFGLDDISFGTLSTFVTLESAPGTDAQTPCVNTAITNIVYAIGGGSAGPIVTGLPAGVTSAFNGVNLTISGTPTIPGTYGYTVTTTGTCNPVSATGTITVQSQTITLASGSGAQTSCLNAPVSNVVYTLGGTATGATITGLPAGVTGTVSGNSYTISGTPTVTGTFNYTITTTGTCTPVTTTGSITVQTQSIALLSGTVTQTRCVNTAISNIIYTVSGTATGASSTGLPTGVNGVYSGGLFIISGTPTAAGTYNYSVTTTGGCTAATLSGTITVNPAAVITLTSAAGTNNQTTCINVPMTDITYSISGGGTGAIITGLPAGVAGTYSGGVFVISGTPSVTGTFNYTINTTGTCAQATATGSITIQGATVVLTSGSATQSVCSYVAISNIVYTVGGTATGAMATGLPAGVTGTYSGGTFTISGTPLFAGNYPFSVTTTGSCAGAAATGTIAVGTGSIGGTLPDVYTCSGGNGVLTLSGHVGTIQNWEYSTDGGITWTTIANVTNTHTYSNVTVPTLFRVKLQNGICSPTYSTNGSVQFKNTWTGITSSDWFEPTNWSDNTLPSASCSEVTIPELDGTAVYPVISSSVATVNNLIIQANASLIVTNATLQISGTIVNNGTFDASNGTIEMNGNTPQSISASTFANNAVKHLVISNTHVIGVGLGGPLDIYGSLTYTGGGKHLSTNGFLTLKSTAAETAWVGDMTGRSISGEVTVERYIATGTSTGQHPKSWQMLAVPTISSQSVKAAWQEGATSLMHNPVPGYGTMITGAVPNATSVGFDVYTAPGSTMKTYNPATSAWVDITNTNSLGITNPNGYMILVRGDRSVTAFNHAATPTILRSKGKLYTPGADAPAPVTVPAGRFQAVGNPYASAIDFRMLGRTNVGDVFYVWDPALTSMGPSSAYGLGGYQTFVLGMDGNYHVTPGGGSYGTAGSVKNTIESGQAFLVNSNMSTTGPAGVVSFNETSKITGSNLVTRESSLAESEIRTNIYVISNGTPILLDGVATQFHQTYSNEVNPADAKKLGNVGETFGMVRNGIALAVERRKSITANDTIFYNFGQVKYQQYRLEFNPAYLDAPGLSAWLEDSYLQTSTPISLTGTTSVDFRVEQAAGSYVPNRFRLVFKQLAPLPVTFVSVSATRNSDATIAVSWKVENETSIEKYTIERSEDGRTFTGILTTGPTHNNGGAAVYLKNDLSPLKASNYYRIQALSRSGQVQYSAIVKVDDIKSEGTITVYPNPVINKTMNIRFRAMEKGNYGLHLISSNGQLVFKKEMTVQSVSETQTIRLGTLTPGNYTLLIFNDKGFKTTQRLFIQ